MESGTIRALSHWKEKYSKINKDNQFKNLAVLFLGAPYEWGHEHILGTDCSGLICGPLVYMGYQIRVTADQLMNSILSPKGQTQLIFFVKDGKATHCGIGLGQGAMIHASGKRGVVIESTEAVFNEYKDTGHHAVVGYLDWEKIEENEGLVYDLDSELH